MKVLENNARQGPKARAVWCLNCHSQLEITDADIKQDRVRGPCCKQSFKCLTEAENTEAYYNK